MRIRQCVTVAALVLFSQFAQTEDIDLFANGFSDDASATAVPNVLIVLDNTSNWSRQNQQWPARAVCPSSEPFCDCSASPTSCTIVDEVQGQAEIAAIKAALNAIGKDLNVGLLEFTTQGNANDDGGYVRFDLQRIGTDSNDIGKQRLFNTLDTIYSNAGDPIEKRNSNTAYGNLIYDVHNYLAGATQSMSGSGTPSLADSEAYTTTYSVFDSPLTEADICAETYVIFISNPNASGPSPDDAVNSNALKSLYAAVGASPAGLAGDGTDGLAMQRFVELSGRDSDTLGYTAACYDTVAECSASVNQPYPAGTETPAIASGCPANGSCRCLGSQPKKETAAGGACLVTGAGKNRVQAYHFQVEESAASGGVVATGIGDVDGGDYNLDDWTAFLQDIGVAVTVPDGDSLRVPVTTYTLDVFNKAPNVEHSALMDSAAKKGGGRRIEVTSYDALKKALTRIFDDIVAVNTSFAAVTLPLSATNRAQQENKIFVGMFRPAKQRKPRWLGNLKQYQLAKFDGKVEMSDAKRYRAINPETGFASSCAVSFWTEDTSLVDQSASTQGPYFNGLGIDPPPVGQCSRDAMQSFSPLSDYPDGAFVEKGGVAQQIRQLATGSGDHQRSVYRLSNTAVTPLEASDATLTYFLGESAGLAGGDCVALEDSVCVTDTNPATPESEEVMPYRGLRSSIHGDVIHSRPLTVTYGKQPLMAKQVTNFRIFYGANDGLFRSVDPFDGTEDWALVADEHVARIERQYRNTPTIDYAGLPPELSSANPPTGIAARDKDYFFDGSTGAYLRYNADGELAEGILYPTMRRGGGKLYAIDISPSAITPGVPPQKPSLKWATQFAGVSQLWSTPMTGFVESEGSQRPLIIFGGGWDECLDVDVSLPVSDCGSGKGVYIVDAKTGELLAMFSTTAPVVADVAPIDFDSDGFWDYAYVLDAAGHLYRLNFGYLSSSTASSISPLDTPLSPNDRGSNLWSLTTVAKVGAEESAIRTMNRPILGLYQKRVFVTFGTGDRERPLRSNYPYSSEVQNYFFAYIDRPWMSPNPGGLNLLGNTLFNVVTDSLSTGQTLDAYDGWYYPIPGRGEQVVNQAAIAGGKVFFNSFKPEGGPTSLCSNLGTATAYSAPLFTPVTPTAETIDGGGLPIPPIIATVRLDANSSSCEGDCGDGVIDDSLVTVCIGCKGFDPIEINPSVEGTLRPTYQGEIVDSY